MRSHYLISLGSADSSKASNAAETSQLSTLLSKFGVQLKDHLKLLQDYYSSELNFYNFNFFKEINKLFVLIYIKNCLKFNLFKKLYF